MTLHSPGAVSSQCAPAKTLTASRDGFSLNGAVVCETHQRNKLERLCRYVSRGPIALERLSIDGDGLVVHELKHPFRDATTHVLLTSGLLPFALRASLRLFQNRSRRFCETAGFYGPPRRFGAAPACPPGALSWGVRTECETSSPHCHRPPRVIASLFTGFPHADVANAGLSAVAVTDDDPELARQFCNELLDQAWDNRAAFVYQVEPLKVSLGRAEQATDGPVILLDHYDNAASGGTMDTMTVLAGILEAGLENVAAFAIHDPQAVQQMIAAGVGASITLALGGKIDMPSIGRCGEPLEVSGRIKLISDGRYRNRGPASKGILMDMGPSVVLDTGSVEIVVISRHQEPNDLGCLLSLGIDPREKRYLMLKSRIHYRAGFADIASQIIECAGVGVCTSDYGQLTFENLRRPIYPLELIKNPGK